MHVQVRSLSRMLQIAGFSVALAIAPQLSHAQDPPPGDSRIGHIDGTVSIQQAGVDSWGLADPNMPVGPGDRLFADPQTGGEAELQAGPSRTYFAPGADITLTDFSSQGVEIGIAAGSAYFFSDGFGPGQALYVSTPNGGISVTGRAGFRVDVYADQQTTVVTNLPNWDPLQLNGGGGFSNVLERNQSIQLSGTNPVYAQPLYPNQPDQFEHWAGAIEAQHQNAISLRYVNPAMIGYADLDRAGDWQPQSAYGPVWFPRVEAGWAPYRYGHWVNRPFYGWVWVADEPWGAAPFHYGRWVTVNGRWGWIPGPREVAPVWSPAQVVFAGGIQVGGVGVSVWFPLGPGEPYKPWYPCSPTYIDRVNISNIHPAPSVVVHNTYVNIVNVTNVTNITYVNRTVGVTAVRQQDFASGHSTRAAIVKVQPQQVEHIQVAAPTVRPPAQPIITHPVAKPAAVQAQRPVLINHQGQQITATAHPRPVSVPVKAAPPAPKPLPGRQATGTPTLGGKPVTPAPAAAAKPANQPATQPAQAAKPAAVNAHPVTPATATKPETQPALGHPATAPSDKAAAPHTQTPAAPQAHPQQTPQPAPAAKTPPPARPLTPAEKAAADKAAARNQKKGEHPKDEKKPESKPE